MRFHKSAIAVFVAVGVGGVHGFAPQQQRQVPSSSLFSTAAASPSSDASAVEEGAGLSTMTDTLTTDLISKLRFRQVQKELELRELDTSGTLTDMKQRLRHAAVDGTTTTNGAVQQESETMAIDENALDSAFQSNGIDFQDESDPDFDFKSLVNDVMDLSDKGHWKKLSRRLKKLSWTFGPMSPDARTIPEDLFAAVMNVYMQDRLHGARAAEPARKAMEEMVANGYSIPEDVANYCVKQSIGFDEDGSHEGFGGIDTALAMLAAIEVSPNPPTIHHDTYEQLISAMAREGSIEHSLQMLREIVVEKSETPSLKVFADIASSIVDKSNPNGDPEKLMRALAYAKAGGYELDSIASTVDGREILAAGVIAAEKMGNIGLGLRFLTAASKAEGCDPDRGDALVATLSPASQRACTIIHRQAINKAVEDSSWKLAVKLLDLMLERGLTPSPGVWRNVVTLCAKEEKSRKATALLLDWLDLYKSGRAEKPPLRIFNTVVNACEVCGEEELTVKVLDAMKETHDTEGNLITFNIALKRLAKQGSTMACEGIIVGMITSGIEPSVVSYTTAIAACVTDPKKSDIAMEWIKRMKSRNVKPNVITYNTALASCLDGTLEGSMRASQLASEMVNDIKTQVEECALDKDEYTNIIPNFYTRTLARQAMKQLKENWESGKIEKSVAVSTVRVPLLELVEFLKTDLAALAEKQKEDCFGTSSKEEDEVAPTTEETDEELEYSAAISTHRAAVV